MGSSNSRSHTTVVANGSSNDILVRVSELNENILKEYKESDVGFGLAVDASLKGLPAELHAQGRSKSMKAIEYDRRDFDEFTRIKPGEKFYFTTGHTKYDYVTIFTESGSKIKISTKNLQISKKQNIVVDFDGYTKHAKKGEIWIDTDGKDHKQIYRSRVKYTLYLQDILKENPQKILFVIVILIVMLYLVCFSLGMFTQIVLFVGNGFVTVISTLLGLFTQIVLFVVNGFVTVISTLLGLFTQIVLFVGNGFITVISTLFGLFTQIVLFVSNGFITAISTLLGLFTQTVLFVGNGFVTVISALLGMFTQIVLFVCNGFVTVISTLLGLFTNK